jgi:transcriptional regulator with XRE-family HTH domain
MRAIRKGTAKKVPHPIDKHVGGRLRMRRMTLGMSQENFADALGLAYQQVQKYEKGTNRISASRLQQSSDILRVPVGFFFEGVPKVPGAAADVPGKVSSLTDLTDFLASSDGLRLAKAFMRIESNRLRRSIIGLVQEIAPEDDT